MCAARSCSPSTIQRVNAQLISSPSGFLVRIRTELNEMPTTSGQIVSVSPIDGTDWQTWRATIKGPPDTPYEDGVFTLHIHFPRDATGDETSYPFTPPQVTFQTRVFHPNIGSKGEICLDILRESWTPALTLEKILLSICALLAAPNIDDFLVPEAAFLLQNDPDEFNKKAKEWTAKYATAECLPAEEDDHARRTEDTIYHSPISMENAELSFAETRRRSARFTVLEPLVAETFDHGESKECTPSVAQCFSSFLANAGGNQSIHEVIDFLNLEEEVQLLLTAWGEDVTYLSRQEKAEEVLQELYKMLGASVEEVVPICLRIYSMDTFFYSQLNVFLRQNYKPDLRLYGPFVRLLYFCFNHPSSVEVHGIDVYRGMDLLGPEIEWYKKASGSDTSFRWSSFISASRNRTFIEKFLRMNTLFIMRLKKTYMREKKAIDISAYSEYPDEEEVLLKAGVRFTVEKVQSDECKHRHYIWLSVYV